MMSYLSYLFKNPDAYENDPSKYLRNQIAHTFLVGYVLLYLMGGPYSAVVAYFVWELAQYLYNKMAGIYDALEDLSCVTSGIYTYWLFSDFAGIAVLPVIIIGAGYYRRKRNVKRV